MLTHCPEMPVFGTQWQTRDSMFSKQTYTSSHQIDQSMWQSPGSFDVVLTVQVGTVSRLWLCQTPWGILCIFGSHTFVPISWMCKNQTSVSHMSTVPEIISLDAGLRVDGFPTHDLWDLDIKVFHSSLTNWRNQKEEYKQTCCVTPNQTCTPTIKPRLQLSTKILNYAMPIAFPQTWSLLNLVRCSTSLKDNEAVIKMLIKGSSPTMRHVSRTHRVALDWLFDRINLDPKIQIKFVDTKHQLADILTKGNFTRDEWINLLHLFNISHFSSVCCSQNFQLCQLPKKDAKRNWRRIVAKSKPTLNMVSKTEASSPTVLQMHQTVRGYSEHQVSKVWFFKRVWWNP